MLAGCTTLAFVKGFLSLYSLNMKELNYWLVGPKNTTAMIPSGKCIVFFLKQDSNFGSFILVNLESVPTMVKGLKLNGMKSPHRKTSCWLRCLIWPIPLMLFRFPLFFFLGRIFYRSFCEHVRSPETQKIVLLRTYKGCLSFVLSIYVPPVYFCKKR